MIAFFFSKILETERGQQGGFEPRIEGFSKRRIVRTDPQQIRTADCREKPASPVWLISREFSSFKTGFKNQVKKHAMGGHGARFRRGESRQRKLLRLQTSASPSPEKDLVRKNLVSWKHLILERSVFLGSNTRLWWAAHRLHSMHYHHKSASILHYETVTKNMPWQLALRSETMHATLIRSSGVSGLHNLEL
jgi:hypothetical protein